MATTKFPNGITIGGKAVAGEQDNKIYIYDSNDTLIATLTFSADVTISAATNITATLTVSDPMTLAQGSALTAAETTITHDAPTTPDYDFTGSVLDSAANTVYGLSSADEFNTLLQVIKNLQTRVNELETLLKNVGLLPS